MTAVEFLEYLDEHDATCEFAEILADLLTERRVAAFCAPVRGAVSDHSISCLSAH